MVSQQTQFKSPETSSFKTKCSATYFSTNTSAPRTTACLSGSRLAKENNSILENCKQMFQEENISDLST